MSLSNFRWTLAAAYIFVLSVVFTAFAAHSFFGAQLARAEAAHRSSIQLLKEAHDSQKEFVRKQAAEIAKAENRAAQLHAYHRGRFEACAMHYVAFGASLNCKTMLRVGLEKNAFARDEMKMFTQYWKIEYNRKKPGG